MNDLTHTLQQLGYPLCPGNVMVNNPKWVHSEQEWKQTLTGWVKKATPDTVVDSAIMADAHAVAGNRDLLLPVKQHLSDLMLGQELILTEFCRPALNFSVPLTLWHYKLKGSPYQPLFTAPVHQEYVSLDCETTSLDTNQAELITITRPSSSATASSPASPPKCDYEPLNLSTAIQSKFTVFAIKV